MGPSPLFTATPVHGELQERLKATRKALSRAYHGCEHATLENSQGVAFGRAELVGMYLAKSKAPLFLSLDADIGVSVLVVDRMVATKADIVVTPYRQRKPPHAWTFQGTPGNVEFSALGCALIRRHVLESLAQTIHEYDSQLGHKAWDMFRPEIFGRRLHEADTSFCIRARAKGFSIVALVGAEVDHDGTFSYLEAA
jgi:hypothetical protein